MAEEIIFKTSVDTGTTAKDLQALEKELTKVNDSAVNLGKDASKSLVDLNQKFEDIYGDLQPLTGRLGELEDRMYELALAGKKNTDEYKALQTEVVKYKKTIIDVDMAIDSLSQKGKGVQAALQLGSTITAGYGALTGAQALLGTESENLTKTLVKLQAVQAILASIEEVRSALEKESILMQKAKAAQTWLLTTATGAYATVVGTSTGAMKLFKIALASTGIGLFIVALGAVVANFDKVKSKTQEVSAKFQEAYKTFANKYPEASKVIKTALEVAFFPITITIKSLEKLYDLFTGTTEASRKAQAVADANHSKHMTQLDEEQKARDKNIQGLDQKIALLEAEGKSTIKLREEKIRLQKADAEANLMAMEHLMNMVKNNDVMRNAYAEMYESAKVSLNNVKIEEAKLGQERKAIANDNAQHNRELADKAKEERALRDQAELDAVIQKLEEERAVKEAEDKWIAEQEAIYQAEKDRIAQQEQELQWSIEAANAVRWKNEVEGEAKTQAEILRIHQETNDAKVKIAQMGTKSLNDLAGAVFAVSNAYGKQDEKSKEDRAKKQFKVMKALSLATAVVDGIQTTMAAFRNGMQNPIPLLGPATAAVYAGAAAITSAANIAKISATKYEGGGGGSVPSVPPPTTVPNTPNPQLANADTTLTSGLSGNTNNQGGGKVFVVDSEITAKQNQTAQALNIATVG